jgi:hypothetical protein
VSRGEDARKQPGEPAMPRTDTGLLAILKALVKRDADFVVIGGVAVGHHGYVRATNDVDVVPAPEPENIAKLWVGLLELDAQPLALGEFRPEELPAPFSLDGLLQGGNWDLRTKHGRLDVIQYLEGALETPEDYRRLRAGAESESHDFGTVWVAGYDELIDLKTLAGREQDLIDIRALREANSDTAP